MKIVILKYFLQHNGRKYKAGDIVDLPKEEAKELVKAAPKEFQLAGESGTEDISEPADSVPNLPPGVKGVSEEEMEGEKALEEMTVAELKEVAKKGGFDISKARTKQAIIDAISEQALARAEEEAGDEVEGLPGDAE